MIDELVERIDIDRDGYIGESDIDTFLGRYNYLESKDVLKKTVFRGLKSDSVLFPKVPLSEEKIEFVLQDIRAGMKHKNMAIYDVLRLLDANKQGFITVSELSKGLDKIVKLSQPAKDGLFAYLDRMKIGMIDYPTLQRFLKRIVPEEQKVRKNLILRLCSYRSLIR